MENITKIINGRPYTFDPSEDNLLKRGLIDPFLQGKSGEWVVLEEFIYWSANIQQIVIVPRWMKTDLASIPALFRFLVSVNDRHIFAALLHDFGYCTGSESGLSRREWDGILLSFCKHLKVPMWKRYAIYAGVRIGGWVAWRKCLRHEPSKHLFIPEQHKPFYIEVHQSLNLPKANGEYLQV